MWKNGREKFYETKCKEETINAKETGPWDSLCSKDIHVSLLSITNNSGEGR